MTDTVARFDPHSYAEPQHVKIKHMALDLNIDFTSQVIRGKVKYTLDRVSKHDKLSLDTKDLIIEEITLDSATRTPYKVYGEEEVLGQKLEIDLLPETKIVTIAYATQPTAQALQWLSPEQTGDKNFPFLFTQGQAILTRSWIPCHDSPGLRTTYEAVVHTPVELKAVMSAENVTPANAEKGDFHFKMNEPIPAYLIALAVGDLQFKAMGARTGVYAEPGQLDAAAYEFGDMERMLEAAEALYGKYAWGRYDVLLLPPSFPFGGMENPRLTFATPTIIAGDRSLTSLIAHELAHSWSGNLVTNATWNDFWLNEGFTVYFERRIMESLYSKSYADMLSVLGRSEVEETVASFGATSPKTQLKLNLEGKDPDEGMNDIAYEKGYLFLCWLESKVGRVAFDTFLKDYFGKNAFQSMNTEQFLEVLTKQLIDKNPKAGIDMAQVKQFIYQPGIPDFAPKITSSRFEAIAQMAADWNQTKDASKLHSYDWSTHEMVHFLRSINKPSVEDMTKLDQALKLTQSSNSEIQFEWYLAGIKVNYKPIEQPLEGFLLNTGRRKFIAPLYKALLLQQPDGQSKAKSIYLRARPNYHFVATNTLDTLINK